MEFPSLFPTTQNHLYIAVVTRFGHHNLKKRLTLFAKFLADDFYGENWTNAIAWADEQIGEAIWDVTVRDY